MAMGKAFRVWGLLTALSMLGGVVGCGAGGPGKSGDQPAEMSHIKKAYTVLNEYRASHNRKVPKDIDEVKPWATKEGKASDDDFNSTRDGEPYVVVTAASPVPGGPQFVIMHERTGKDGKKYLIGGPAGGETPHEETDESIENQTHPPKLPLQGRPPGR